MLPADVVRETLLACLPPGVPPSFNAIVRVECRGRNEIHASLAMFDAQPATVILRRWSMGWSHQFVDMPGGAASFENGKWSRVNAGDREAGERV